MDIGDPHARNFGGHLRLKNLSPRTIGEYSRILKAVFTHLGPGVAQPSDITTAMLREYVAGLQARGLSAKSVSDHVLVIKRFFGFLLAT